MTPGRHSVSRLRTKGNVYLAFVRGLHVHYLKLQVNHLSLHCYTRSSRTKMFKESMDGHEPGSNVLSRPHR